MVSPSVKLSPRRWKFQRANGDAGIRSWAVMRTGARWGCASLRRAAAKAAAPDKRKSRRLIIFQLSISVFGAQPEIRGISHRELQWLRSRLPEGLGYNT